ncbi:hypothetical protein Q5H93_22265 [Hymenobacter sp. ASUV-10]|uniref:Uncharacterized protein n=1 Tax=Hymenobacter aranciens TaxID=3063996 RepID=A0ABT9BI45_9BACT|nr:hypothetical protein [Hymenobacter sp. ASUV-10]MDO7877480.1 hypothetical protein [Hymenobacter sp. ASUV-10]
MQFITSLLKALKRGLGPGGWTWLGTLFLLANNPAATSTLELPLA